MFSVIMSVYKESIEYLRNSIESILNQTFEDFEFIIVVDNPEAYNQIEYLNYIESVDSRVKIYVNKKNVGLSSTLNFAINKAKGEYLIRMDADDIASLDRIESLVENSYLYPEVDVFFSKYIVMNDSGDSLKNSENMPVDSELLSKILRFKNIICHPTIMMKKSTVIKFGGYSRMKNSEDFELWVRLLKNGCKFRGVNQNLLFYRISQNSMTTSDYFKSYIAVKFVNEYHSQVSGVPTNEEFLAYLLKKSRNKDRFNRFAEKYFTIINSWSTYGSRKYIALFAIFTHEPRLFDLFLRTACSNFLRRLHL